MVPDRLIFQPAAEQDICLQAATITAQTEEMNGVEAASVLLRQCAVEVCCVNSGVTISF
jgi:hypothetical protein